MLLLTIVVGTILVVYAYVSGATILPDTDEHVNKMLEKLKTTEVKGYLDGHFDVYITNTGSVDSVIDMFYVKDFLGGTLTAKEVTAPIAVGDTEEFLFDPYLVGQSPWSWYEIVGVTNRGNKFTVNLYGFYSGAYELGEGPHEYTAPNGSKVVEVDYLYNVNDVTIDGIPASPSDLQNLTSIDGSYFGFPATNWTDAVGSFPIAGYELDFNSNAYTTHGENINDLRNFGSSMVWHFNMHPGTGIYELSAIFNGSTPNMKYPKLTVTFIFDLQNSGYSTLNGTLQFYNWTSNQFVTSGTGFVKFNGSSIAFATSPPAVSGYRNLTLEVNSQDVLGPDGEWKFIISMTNTGNDNVKLDYLEVKEQAIYIHSFETLFWYSASNVAYEENVTQLTFSVTGLFPTSAPSYWYAVYNFDAKKWYYLGEFLGSDSRVTHAYQLTDSCASFIENGTKNVLARIFPSADLPSLQMIYVDQSRLIIRQLEYRPT